MPRVYILCGYAFAGKTTLAKALVQPLYRHCSCKYNNLERTYDWQIYCLYIILHCKVGKGIHGYTTTAYYAFNLVS
jgi:hypothetical protein